MCNRQVKIQTGSGKYEKPHEEVDKRIDNLHEVSFDIRIPALVVFIHGGQGTNNALKSSESPLNTLKSTLPLMPFTLPVSLCCQKLQSRLMRG